MFLQIDASSTFIDVAENAMTGVSEIKANSVDASVIQISFLNPPPPFRLRSGLLSPNIFT